LSRPLTSDLQCPLRYLRFPWRAVAFGEGGFCFDSRRKRTPAIEIGSIPAIIKSMSTVAEIKTAAGGLVVSNPGILGGTPVFCATRLPVQTLFDYLADGLTIGYFLDTFEGVTLEQARAVLLHGWERIAAELAE
jgi:uncharacterized protein (DUF433 family)